MCMVVAVAGVGLVWGVAGMAGEMNRRRVKFVTYHILDDDQNSLRTLDTEVSR